MYIIVIVYSSMCVASAVCMFVVVTRLIKN